MREGNRTLVNVDGKTYPSIFKAAVEIGCNYSWLWCRLRAGQATIKGRRVTLARTEKTQTRRNTMKKAMTITLTNCKGGTGKTSLSTFLAEQLLALGKKVLVVDLDPNCSISEIYGYVLKDSNSKALMSGLKTEPYTVKTSAAGGALDLIPSDLNLGQLANIIDTQIKIQLKKQGFVERYDYIILDPPGTWNSQTRNAVFAADSVIVVGKCSPLDFEATRNYIAMLSECGIEADTTVVCNAYSAQRDPDKILDKYREAFGGLLLPAPVPEMTSLKRLAYDPEYRIRADIAEKLRAFVRAATLETEDAE